MTRRPPGSPSSGLVNQILPIVSRDRVSVVMLPAGTPAATAICAMAVASARGGGGSYMPYAPDITIRAARPERYKAAARRARATVAGRGSPSAVMPPPRATTTSALTGDTGPMLPAAHPAAQPRAHASAKHDAAPPRPVTCCGGLTAWNDPTVFTLRNEGRLPT